MALKSLLNSVPVLNQTCDDEWNMIKQKFDLPIEIIESLRCHVAFLTRLRRNTSYCSDATKKKRVSQKIDSKAVTTRG